MLRFSLDCQCEFVKFKTEAYQKPSKSSKSSSSSSSSSAADDGDPLQAGGAYLDAVEEKTLRAKFALAAPAVPLNLDRYKFSCCFTHSHV